MREKEAVLAGKIKSVANTVGSQPVGSAETHKGFQLGKKSLTNNPK